MNNGVLVKLGGEMRKGESDHAKCIRLSSPHAENNKHDSADLNSKSTGETWMEADRAKEPKPGQLLTISLESSMSFIVSSFTHYSRATAFSSHQQNFKTTNPEETDKRPWERKPLVNWSNKLQLWVYSEIINHSDSVMVKLFMTWNAFPIVKRLIC